MTLKALMLGADAKPEQIAAIPAALSGYDLAMIQWQMNDPNSPSFFAIAAAVPAEVDLVVCFIPQPVPDGWPSVRVGDYVFPNLQDGQMPGLLQSFYETAGQKLEEAGLLGRVKFVGNCPIAGYDGDGECGLRVYSKTGGRMDAEWAAAGYRASLFSQGFANCVDALVSQPWMEDKVIRQPWFTPGDPPRVLEDGTVGPNAPNVYDMMLQTMVDCGEPVISVMTVYTGGELQGFQAKAAEAVDMFGLQFHGYDKGNVFTAAMLPQAEADAANLDPDILEYHWDTVTAAAAPA
jgi:hypothetical protein